MTVFSQGPRSWMLICDGFDSETFDKCQSKEVLSKLTYTLSEAMRRGAPDGWSSDSVLGKHYCSAHKTWEKR